jgi:hypothetical protein
MARCDVRYVRLYTDSSGQSRFEESDIELRPVELGVRGTHMDMSTPVDTDRAIFASIHAGFFGERHTAPHRQYFFQLGGVIEVEVADGAKVRTGPGSITLIEDTQGSGHITTVIGDEPVTGVFVQLPG